MSTMAELKLIQQMVENLPEDERQKVNQCAELLDATINEFGDNGIVALALVGLMYQDAAEKEESGAADGEA